MFWEKYKRILKNNIYSMFLCQSNLFSFLSFLFASPFSHEFIKKQKPENIIDRSCDVGASENAGYAFCSQRLSSQMRSIIFSGFVSSDKSVLYCLNILCCDYINAGSSYVRNDYITDLNRCFYYDWFDFI